MSETGDEFANFRALHSGADVTECDMLIRNMAKLFVHVAERCDDEQIAKYDDVLCQLSDVVELEARKYVSEVFSKLPRAPGTVITRLAGDAAVEVAQPILAFSPVLTDDDLIEIVSGRSEMHRMAIAGRSKVTTRVSGAIFEFGEQASMVRLASNENAEIDPSDAAGGLTRVGGSSELQQQLQSRDDLDWRAIQAAVVHASKDISDHMDKKTAPPAADIVKGAQAVAYNKIRNRAGFNKDEWYPAWSQVQALNDRNKLDSAMIMRFCRFGYGHHVAAGFTKMANMPPAAMLTWLARSDLIAVTVAARANGFDSREFESIVATLPWVEQITQDKVDMMVARFDQLPMDEASDIFSLWRRHGFRESAQRSGQGQSTQGQSNQGQSNPNSSTQSQSNNEASSHLAAVQQAS